MNDIFGSVFAIIWFIVIFNILKGVGKSKKNGGSFGKVKEPVGRTGSSPAKPRKLGTSDSAEQMPQMGSYKSDFDEIDKKAAPGHRRELKAGEARPARAALRETSALSEFMVEDRQHDWLARQIREEKKHVVWNNFVDLGAVHDEACAAELNRRDHHRQHQSYVVDDGITDN